ncbi:bifunctional lysylphosphatidylglycerol flippase/synthetase MprF [Pseudonocardia adelaidensis]|uniref:Bifunctional lysylphosphatidylglycerol flippase/synthetase MprF n=1 Tax=Pseudonocardia adelaidensis TaxID=648754 RepID=A0ABP9P3V9_9PSEU
MTGLVGLVRSLVRVIRRAPLSVAFVLMVWAYGLATRSLPGGPGDRLLQHVGTGVGPLEAGRWWTPVSAMLWWGTIGAALVTTALVLFGGALAEHRIGGYRTGALLVGTQVVGTLIALSLVGAGAALGSGWQSDLAAEVVVGAAPGAVGLILAASSTMTALWRRRLRLLVLAALTMLVAYSGELPEVIMLCSGLVGFAAGRLLGRPERHPGPASRTEVRVLIALVVAASAVGPIVAAISHSPIGPLSVLQFVVLSPPPDAATVQQICATSDVGMCRGLQAQLRLSGIGPALASTIPVLLLLVVADGLRRGRRAALVVGIALNLVLAALGVLLAALVVSTPVEQLMVYQAAPGARRILALTLPPLLPLAVAALLWWTRDRFAVRAPTGTYRRLLVTSVSVLVAVSAAYVLLGAAVADQFDRPPTLGQLLVDLPERFLPPGYLGEVDPDFLPQGFLATLLFEWTGVVFWLVVAGGLLSAFRRPRAGPEAGDAARARELARRGGSNLGWLTTWPGNAYWFDERGEAAVAHRVIGSVALTTADPIGTPDGDTVAEFGRYCQEHSWTPAFYSVTDDTRKVCESLGWSSVQVAEETVLPLPELTFTGKKWQDVRTALNRAAKAGITAEWIRYADAPLSLTDQVRAISEEWVADKGLPEMGFTLGGLDELADPEVRCLLAVDADRTVHGVTSWLPVHRDGAVIGWTLDFMRRRESGFRGVMEFLIASAVQRFQEEDAQFLSLSGAPLARLDRGEQPAALQRLLDVIGHALEPVYGFRSLLAFKAKFQPEYRPLHLCYPDPAALPAIGLAIARAYLPEVTARQSARLLTLRARARSG